MGRGRWLVAIVAVLLLAEGTARILGGHIAATDERGHPELEYKWGRIRSLAHTPQAPGVLAFGNSMMDGAFIPSVFTGARGGPSAYNAAFLNAPLVTIEQWADRVIDVDHPGTVVAMVHPLDTVEGNVSFGQDGGTLAPSFANAMARIDPGPFDRLTDRAGEASALVRYRTTLRQPAELWGAIEATVHGDPKPTPQRIDEAAPLHQIDWATALDAQGWNSRFKDGALAPDAKFPLGFVGDLTEGSFDTAPLRHLFARLSQVPRAVVVIPPVATAVLDRSGIPASFMARRGAKIKAMAETAGLEVVDLSGAGYPTSLFHDPVHLNRAGAERFSTDLAAAMAR